MHSPSSLVEQLALILRLTIATTLNLLGFAVCVGGMNALAFVLVAASGGGPGGWMALGSYVFACALGVVMAALLANWSAPALLRFVFRTTQVEPELPWARTIDGIFRKAGVEGISIEILERHGPRFHNALVAGSRRIRLFPPVLILTASVARGLSEKELHAVVAHEAAHLALGHLGGRFRAMAKATSLAAVGVFLFFWGAILFCPPWVAALGALILPWTVALAPWRALKRINRTQELEADAFAVRELGADSQALIAALEKIERWSGRQERPPSPKETHPSPAERAQALQSLSASTSREAA